MDEFEINIRVSIGTSMFSVLERDCKCELVQTESKLEQIW